MDALIKWGIIAAVVAACAAGVWKAWDAYVAEPYRMEGREDVRRKELGPLKKSLDAADKLAQERGALLDKLAAATAARMAKASAAIADAQRRADAAETRVQTIMALQPGPGTPCEAACRLLAGPL